MEDDEDSEHDDEVLGLGEEAPEDASEKVSLTEPQLSSSCPSFP
jgi:hypothetical protein